MKEEPLQTVGVKLLIAGFGLIVTVTVKVGPEHVPDVGVTVYVAVVDALVVLVRVPVIDAPLPADPPEKFDPAGTPHE